MTELENDGGALSEDGGAAATATRVRERGPVSMTTRGQRIMLWTAPPAGALFVIGFFLFPLFSPPL